jgi:hypothetical protein
MSDEVDRLVAKAQEKLHGLELDIRKTKDFINQLREFDGQAPLYTDLAAQAALPYGPIRSDQFFGRPLATVIREILEMRQAANQGAASVAEIHARLVEGGYAFETTNEENQRRSLRISLTKNPAFLRVPGGSYGLTEWYPNPPRKRLRLEENGSADTEEAEGDPEVADEVEGKSSAEQQK